MSVAGILTCKLCICENGPLSIFNFFFFLPLVLILRQQCFLGHTIFNGIPLMLLRALIKVPHHGPMISVFES